MTTNLNQDAEARPFEAASRVRFLLLERVDRIRSTLSAGAAQADRDRRLPASSVDAIADAGLFKLTVPRRFGGWEASVGTLIDVFADIGEECSSSAWVAMILNGCNWMVAHYGEEAQQEVFGQNPEARTCGQSAPTGRAEQVPGGVVVSGRWGFASGCYQADWAFVGVPRPGATAPGSNLLALVPMSELTIDDTWFVTGMRGTASNTLVAEDVFVPEHRLLSPPDGGTSGASATGTIRESLYRSSLFGFLGLILDGPLLGMGRAALRSVVEAAPHRAITNTVFRSQDVSAYFQAQVAEAATQLQSAELHVARAASDIDGAAIDGRDLDLYTRARIKADYAWAATLIRRSVDQLASAHGTASMSERSPLQRIWRDVNTASRHAMLNQAVATEVWGQVLLGHEPSNTIQY